MNASGIFPGTYRINDRGVTDKVIVSLTDYEISLSDASRATLVREALHLRPVLPKMFSHIGSAEKMRSGVSYSISGSDVGAFICGPLGSPGDGEFDHRPVLSFDVAARFTREELSIAFSGVTGVGRSGFRERTKPLDPWKFDVRFTVPRAELIGFLQLEPSTARYFLERLDAC